MRNIIIIIVFFVAKFNSFATYIRPDRLIFDNDTLALNSFPFSSKQRKLWRHLNRKDPSGANCFSGYFKERTIIDNQLYLTNVYNCKGENVNQEVERVLNDKFENGRLKAKWFTGELYAGFGHKQLFTPYMNVYEREKRCKFRKGVLQNCQELRAQNVEKENIERLVYENFNWDLVPLDGTTSFSVFVFHEGGKIDKLYYSENSKVEIQKEIERIFSSIPHWGYFNWGEVYLFPQEYTFQFSEENRNKFNSD